MIDTEIENLRWLKESIECGVVKETYLQPLIFVYADNSFLAHQYAREIAKKRNLTIRYIDSFDDFLESLNYLFSFEADEDLTVYFCDKFECSADISSLKNVIIICKETSQKTNVFKFPKLESWQIKSYMSNNCPGLNSSEIDWLYDITTSLTKNNEHIYRLDAEIKKISCFPEAEQEIIFKELSAEDGYSDLSSLTIFNLTNAVLKKDVKTVSRILSEIDSIDVEGVGLITLLHKNFKQVIDIQMSKNVSAQSMGITEKQFKAIEYNCGKYTSKELVRIFKFLTGLDAKLKSGNLELSNSRMIDYIICEVMK